jgi:hemerythrin-like domain-containing protein
MTPDRSDVDSPAARDPVLSLRRDHTLLEMLAEGFHQVARNLATGSEVAADRIREGLEVHRLFLIETHHRREKILEEALAQLPGAPYAAELERCRTEHEAGRRAAEGFEGDVARLGAGDRSAGTVLAAAMDREALRWMEHHRWEEEHFYPAVHDRIPRELSDRIGEAMRSVRNQMGGVEERLVSWTSSLGPSSD